MVEVKWNEKKQKIAVMKNVHTGEVYEKNVNTLIANPKSNPHQNLVESGLTNAEGLVDVNPYTLQHKRYENVFAFGDCTDVDTTRTQYAAMAQNPIVKHNVLNYLSGKELNAIYDGYSYMPLVLGQHQMTNFQHLHDFEPHWKNNWNPAFGVFSWGYFKRYLKTTMGEAEKYSSFKKNNGPPFWNYSARYNDLEHNDYLKSHSIPLESVRQFPPVNRLEENEDHKPATA